MESDLRLAFEPLQDDNVKRLAFSSLKQGRLSMLEYTQRASHLVSCDGATDSHGATSPRLCFRDERWLSAFLSAAKDNVHTGRDLGVALRENHSVTAPHALDFFRPLTPADPAPTPMEIDAVQQQYGGRWEPASPQRSSNTSSTRGSSPMRCWTTRGSVPRAVSRNGETSPLPTSSLKKKGDNQ
ncbi:hypothetical protein PR003_g651 [Phytophthora rubi]|uniref:Retrotransposon gag domain-containing protein n=1 Tax=Phytophthora rubi TaxID=129364 RepID=A0A6A4G3Y4_9STRA|nr:hypothetical protein PR003_g651 [Phytophthora rubi]